jgi:hypothetical protein
MHHTVTPHPDLRIVLDRGQPDVLAAALADAITHRIPDGHCLNCAAHPTGLCDDHGPDVDLADAYIALGHELGIEVAW